MHPSIQSMILADHYIANHIGGAENMKSSELMNMGYVAGGLSSKQIEAFPKDVYW